MRQYVFNKWYLNAMWVFALAILYLAAGSAATAWFFAGCGIATIYFLIGRERFQLSRETFLALTIPAVLFLTKLPSPMLFSNSEQGWSIVFSNLNLVVLFVPAASLLLTPSIDYLTLFTRGLSLGLIAALITGFFQKFYLGMMIPEAMMGNALVYASISQIAGLFVFASYKRENGLWRWLYVLAFLSSVVILIITLRRMPLFVFCIELILIAAFFSWYVRPTKLQIIAIVVGLITAGTTSIIVMASTGSLFDKRIVSQWQMLQEHGLTTDAVIDEYRLTLYRHGIGVVADHPFLGVGLQNATDTAIRRAEDEENRSIKNFTHLHNEYLNATAGSGIPGLVATILFLIAPIMMTLRSTKDSRYPERMFVAIGLTGSYSILGLTNLITGHDLMLGFFCFSYLVLVLANEQADRNLSLVLKRAANPRSEAMS